MGGYGRSQQLPRSDIDLLLVHDGADPAGVAEVAERLLYPLWDAGFEVGHAVRTPLECVSIAREHLDALHRHARPAVPSPAMSALPDGCGDAVRRVGHRRSRRDSRGVGLGCAGERAERVGSAAHRLEPDLKSGAGGLRDIQAIGWLETAWAERDDPGWALRPRDRDALADAEEFLTRARSALQLETGKRSDRLPLDLQPRSPGRWVSPMNPGSSLRTG